MERDNKMKNNLIAISILIFSLCFVLGCWLIADELSDSASSVKPIDIRTINNEVEREKQLLTTEELALYLGISVEEVMKLGPITNGPYTESQIPYIKIGLSIYYPKQAIDEWLKTIGGINITN